MIFLASASRAAARSSGPAWTQAPPDMPSAEQGAIALFERSAVIAALRTLPPRQREALALRFYADMSEAQIADAMQISRRAVRSHTARAMRAPRTVLGPLYSLMSPSAVTATPAGPEDLSSSENAV